MSSSLDVIIIGAGSAGLAALHEVRKATERFVLINDGPYGTTCARVGCMPSKLLIEAAHAFHRRHGFEEFGIRGGEALRIDVPAVLRRVRALRDDFVAGVLEATAGLGGRNIAGRARLIGPNRVEVDGRELSAGRIIIATGSRPVLPERWRAFGDRVLTTDTLFEEKNLSGRVAVVGLGAIGIEIAQALARLGIAVVGFGSRHSLAGLTDPSVNEALRGLLEKEFAVHTGSSAELLATPEGIEVDNGEVRTVVDRVVAAVGRRPNIDGLGVESLGVTLDERGLPPIDPRTMQIADLPIFLAGDATGRFLLLHEAADGGHIAGRNAITAEPACFTRRTPLAIVFSDPNVAMVGKRFAELDESVVAIGAIDFERQGRARAAQRNKGLMRLYADKGDGRLLGAEICVPAGEHMAHLLALAIERSLTVHELLRMPFYHPVLEEGLRSALRELAKQLPPCGDFDLASCDAFQVEALD